MSIIQKIRDKYARIAVFAIVLALLGFILMDRFSGPNSMFSGGGSSKAGSVNGKSISWTDFEMKVQNQEKNLEQQQYGPPQAPEERRMRAVEDVWNNEVYTILMESETDKLGITVTDKELDSMISGSNPHRFARQYWSDQTTGAYDVNRALGVIGNIKRGKDREQIKQLNIFFAAMEQDRRIEKFNKLFAGSTNIPRWFVDKQNAENSLMAKVSLVKEFYTSIPDSTVKVSDEEISAYYNKHKDEYEQNETRSISYVTFSAQPTANDSAMIKSNVGNLKSEFDTTKNAELFLVNNASSVPYSNIFVSKNEMQMGYKDSILALPINGVFGPYLSVGTNATGSTYALAKLLEVKTLPDSVKCRHILLGTADRSGNPIMDDSVAHAKADSIALAIKNGANFDTLETKYTTDQSAHSTKGVMTFGSSMIQGEGFAKEFGQFILFDGKPGDKKVVKTQFGWHYIEIMSFINSGPHYKVAYMAKVIEPSPETYQQAANEASQFAGDSRDQKSFDANFDKYLKPKGMLKNLATEITPTEASIRGLGASRSFIKAIYAAKLGEVIQSEQMIGDNYVVAVVTEVNEKGNQSLAKAKSNIEFLLRKKKQAELIRQKIGPITSLEGVSGKLAKPIEFVDSLRADGTSKSPTLGREYKITGAALNPANKGKVVPELIEGTNGVFVIRVDDVSATPNPGAETLKSSLLMEAKQNESAIGSSIYEGLKKIANIKDKRTERY